MSQADADECMSWKTKVDQLLNEERIWNTFDNRYRPSTTTALSSSSERTSSKFSDPTAAADTIVAITCTTSTSTSIANGDSPRRLFIFRAVRIILRAIKIPREETTNGTRRHGTSRPTCTNHPQGSCRLSCWIAAARAYNGLALLLDTTHEVFSRTFLLLLFYHHLDGRRVEDRA